MVMSVPTIIISADEELKIVLRVIYYHVPGFVSNAKKLLQACQQEEYNHFRLRDIEKWLKNQYVHQMHLFPQKCKAGAGFQKVSIPNKVHQCDLLAHGYDDQDGEKIYLYTLVVIDIATRNKNGRSLTSKNSLEVWNAIEEIYNDSNNPLTWPKLLMLDGGRDIFHGECNDIMFLSGLLIFIVLKV